MFSTMNSIFSDAKRMARFWKRRKLNGIACKASRATTTPIISRNSGCSLYPNAPLIGVINPNSNSRNTAVSEPTTAIAVIAVVNTVSGLLRSSLAKRNRVVSIPKVSNTSISAT